MSQMPRQLPQLHQQLSFSSHLCIISFSSQPGKVFWPGSRLGYIYYNRIKMGAANDSLTLIEAKKSNTHNFKEYT